MPGIYRKLKMVRDKEDLIKRVVSMEFNRFLDYYKNAPEIEQPKQGEKRAIRKNVKTVAVTVKKQVEKLKKVIPACS